jgi:ATP-dependent Clp protease ATP-binding subunit ClpA
MFPPEFRNRLDGIVMFNPLRPEVMGKIVDKFIIELDQQLSERGVRVEISPMAREWLAKRGYDEKLGARPLSRIIQESIKQPLANEILFGALEKGGTAMTDVEDDKLVFTFETNAPDDDDDDA